MAIQSKVSLPVIKRLPKYYRYLTTLSADGKEKISSSELAHMMGIIDVLLSGIVGSSSIVIPIP